MGAGPWGRNLVRVIYNNDSSELAWVVDPDAQALANASAIAPGVAVIENIEAALDDVQLVVVCTPVRDHMRHVRSLLARGKDVLVEKPFAMNCTDAESLVAESGKRGTILMVGHQLLYHPVFLKLESLIRENVLGPLRSVRAERTGSIDFNKEPGVLWSYGPHDVAMILALVGEMPDEVSATGVLPAGDVEKADVVDVSLRFSSGVNADIHLAAVRTTRTRRLTVKGEKRTAVFDDAVPGGRLYLLDGHDQDTVDVEFVEPLAREYAHFIECSRHRSIPRSGPEHAVSVTRILEKAAGCLNGAQGLSCFAEAAQDD